MTEVEESNPTKNDKEQEGGEKFKFLPTDDGLPCPITELSALHPLVLKQQATINIGLNFYTFYTFYALFIMLC